MKSICSTGERSALLSRRFGFQLRPHHHHHHHHHHTSSGKCSFYRKRINAAASTSCIQPSLKDPFHIYSIHPHQQRTIFNFFPSNPSRDNLNNDDNNTNNHDSGFAKTDLTMPSRQTDTSLINKHQDEQQFRYQSNLRKAEMKEILNSPIGADSFSWLQVEKLLNFLIENDENTVQAFRILDRAVKEQDAKHHITHDMVYQVTQQWLTGYVNQQKSIDKPHTYYHKNTSRHETNDSNNNKRRMLSPLNVWKKIENYQRLGIPLESPTYHKIMEGTTHVKSKVPNNPNGARLAELILDRMMAQSKRNNPLIRPSSYTFTVALLSWEQTAAYSPIEAKHDAPQRALALLNKLKSLYSSGWGVEFLPGKNAYRRVMNIFAHRGDGDQVEALLEDLYTLYLDHYEQDHENSNLLSPTTPFFSLALYAWSKSRDPMAAERAEAILERMLEMEKSGEMPDLRVQTNFFNIVMVCWSKQRTAESAQKVQAIFDRLVEYSKTDSSKKLVGASYMALITTHARFDPAKAEEIFWQWKKEHDEGTCEMRIDGDLIRTLVASWCKSKENDAAERCDRLIQFALESDDLSWDPSSSVFNMIINKFCQTKALDGFKRGEELLRQMQEIYKNNPRSGCKPNNLTYLPIVRSWAEIGQMEKSEELLIDYFAQRKVPTSTQNDSSNDYNNNNSSFTVSMSEKEQHLDTRLFNCVLKGWLPKASAMPEVAVRAEDTLLLTKTYGAKPNYASFQYVLDAWRKNKASFNSPWNQERPRVDEVLSLLDREYGRVDKKRELYLTLRQGWMLLSVH
jgi:hypothetical protein